MAKVSLRNKPAVTAMESVNPGVPGPVQRRMGKGTRQRMVLRNARRLNHKYMQAPATAA
jgi:hypothetical protein